MLRQSVMWLKVNETLTPNLYYAFVFKGAMQKCCA